MTELHLHGRRVVVAGGGTAGMSAARFLLGVGAVVTIADDRFADSTPHPGTGKSADVTTGVAGSEVTTGVVGADAVHAAGARLTSVAALLVDDSWAATTDLVIASPGFAPGNPLMVAAAEHEIPVWGEVELAWRVDRAGLAGAPRTWLVVTGTNGKTTTTSMLTDIVIEGGRSAAACGNIGLPVLDAMTSEPRVDVLCAELSSFQLHWAPSITPDAGVVLNVADDHLDWHGSFAAYAADKQTALRGAVGVVGLDDAVASGLPVAGRRVGFTLGEPAPGELGVVDGDLVDRAFTVRASTDRASTDRADDRRGHTRLVSAESVHPAGPSGVSDALAAAALALAIDIDPSAIGRALSAFRPAAHRGEVVATVDGIDFVDDSKATNPHAAEAAIGAHTLVVLIAGGLLKGASVDQMIAASAHRLAGVVAIGRDRDIIVDAISRHAPKVPTVTVFTGDDGSVIAQRALGSETGSAPSGVHPHGDPGNSGDLATAVMNRAVAEAWTLATATDPRPDAVLLAPAAASLDMFAGYGRRGDAFAAAARSLPGNAPRATQP